MIEHITPMLALECILLTVGIFTFIKWVSWNIIDQTKIVETIGNFIGNCKRDKTYYFRRHVKVFNNVKIIITLIWIALPITHLFCLGMSVIR